ncbi:MAG: ABC transporter ATP-binding protein [Candidatus Methanomethylophilaceae archaeon]
MRMDVEDVSQGYDEKLILEDISFSAESGELITILGPNGSGKSTLIKTICNIMAPRTGSIRIDGNDVGSMEKKQFARMVGYVPQASVFFSYTSVYETVLLGRRPYIEWSYSREDLNIAANAMIAMKVDEFADKYVTELSGGQMQRVFIARSLAQDPNFYIFDEPTSSLDLKHQLDTMLIMRDIIRRENSCLIVALHDLNLALRFSDKIMVLKDRRIYDFGTADEVVTPKMVEDVYGVPAELVSGKHGKYIHPYSEKGSDG